MFDCASVALCKTFWNFINTIMRHGYRSYGYRYFKWCQIQVQLTVFFRRDMGDMFKPAMIAIRELKLPMLKHSRAVSIQYSTTRTRCFFFACYKTVELFLIKYRILWNRITKFILQRKWIIYFHYVTFDGKIYFLQLLYIKEIAFYAGHVHIFR